MNKVDYMKKEKNREGAFIDLTADEIVARFKGNVFAFSKKRAIQFGVLTVIFLFIFTILGIQVNNYKDEHMISFSYVPSEASSKSEIISIPSGIVKANPFVPYRNIDSSKDVIDVPNFDLVEPPEALEEGSDAARILDTIVSGILYDKSSPSAILNIEGNDYLVKKGDIVNNYKVLNIERNSVTVKLGKNTFKAGIGEILTEGSVTYNDVSNLSKKFGGEKR